MGFIGIVYLLIICACKNLSQNALEAFLGIEKCGWVLPLPLLSPQSLTTSRSNVNTLVFSLLVVLLISVGKMRYGLIPTYQLLTIFLFPQAQVRLKGAGLGAKGSAYGLSGADSYKDAVRKAMFARFTEME